MDKDIKILELTVEIIKSMCSNISDFYPNKQNGINVANCIDVIYNKLSELDRFNANNNLFNDEKNNL